MSIRQVFEIYLLQFKEQPFPRRYIGLARSATDAEQILGAPVDPVRGAVAGRLVAEPLPWFVNYLFNIEVDPVQ
jgi:hypothetical protein